MADERTSSLVMDTPIGLLEITVRQGRVVRIGFAYEVQPVTAEIIDPLLVEVRKQVEDYFQNASAGFQLPLDMVGTDFQQRVWRQLRQIPPGETCTYGEIARWLGTAPRAVGNACRNNPIILAIPCHRVVSASGIGGFSGQTEGRWPRIKRWLLTHEGVAS